MDARPVLIDTGASVTCVNEVVFGELGVKPVGVTKMGYATDEEERATYPARLTFPETGLPSIDFKQVVGVNIGGQVQSDKGPVIAVLGRNVLSGCVLVYNGMLGTVTLAM